MVIVLAKIFQRLDMQRGLLWMVFFVTYMSVLRLILMRNLCGEKNLTSGWIAFLPCSGSLRLKKGCVKGRVWGKLVLLLPYLDRFGGKMENLFPEHVIRTAFCGYITFALLD